MPWNMSDNKTNLNQLLLTHYFELFVTTLCSFVKYLVKLTLRFATVKITFLDITWRF